MERQIVTNVNAQDPHRFVCYTVDTTDGIDTISGPPPIMTQPPPNTTCNKNSGDYQNFYRWPANYIPDDESAYGNPLGIEKKVKYRFVVVEANPTGPVKQNFRPGDEHWLYFLDSCMNHASSNLAPLSKPTSTCLPCHIEDQRIRYELTDIEFIQDSGSYSALGNTDFLHMQNFQDTILNVFLIPTPDIFFLDIHPGDQQTGEKIYSPGGWSSSSIGFAGGLGKNFTGAYHVSDHHIMMMNTYLHVSTLPIARPYLHPNDLMNIEAIRLLHEFNHAMGLGHLFDILETCDVNHENYLTDIFSGGTITCPTNDTGQNPFDPLTNSTNNIMDRAQHSSMTPLQIGRNHRSAYVGSFKNYVYPVHRADSMPYRVQTNETWEFAIRMYQDIVVAAGRTLTIKCDVQMPPDGRILVERGAKLIIDGGIVRSYHKGNRWKGIELVGNRNASANQTDQGYVELKNGAIIEQANNGIRNFTWDNGAQGGGIIKATNAHFYNNWRAIELNDYENFASSINVSGCTFTIDDMSGAKFGKPFESQVTSWAVKRGTRFYNNIFKIELDQDKYPQRDRRFGIQTSKTGMSIESNTFDGFSKGIYVSDYAGVADRPVWIYHNTFENNTQGILVGANSYSNIRDNNISKMYRFIPGGLAGMSDYAGYAYGIYLDNTQGSYVGCGNQIDGTPQDDGLNKPIIGIIAHNTSAQGATILDNMISKAYAGVQTQRRNNNINITCNNFTANQVGLLVNPQSRGGISAAFKDQGTGCDANTELRAGNKFNVVNNSRDIESYLVSNWQYWAFLGSGTAGAHQVAYNTNGNINNTTCDMTPSSSDPNTQCNKWQNCVYAVPREAIATHRSTLKAFALGGLKYEAEGQALTSTIVKAYYDADDDAGLIEFFEDQGDDNAYRSLIPLYIEAGRYADIDTPILRMSIDSMEKVAYKAYYDILAALKQSGRRPNQLTGGEYFTVETLAADDLEVSAFAKALLEEGYSEEWEHEVEEEPLSPMSYKVPNLTMLNATIQSGLGEIAPNPAGNYAMVKTHITQEDAIKKPHLLLRDFTGKVIGNYSLDVGDSQKRISTENLKPGLYIISLMINDSVRENRKIAIVR
jgi:parallel beta-helix repeat protein